MFIIYGSTTYATLSLPLGSFGVQTKAYLLILLYLYHPV